MICNFTVYSLITKNLFDLYEGANITSNFVTYTNYFNININYFLYLNTMKTR